MKLDHISHSQIDMYLGCPRRWYYKYIERKAERPSGNLIQGSAYHKALEINFTQKISTTVDLPLDEVLDVCSDAVDIELIKAKNIDSLWAPEPYLKDSSIGLTKEYHTRYAPGVLPLEVEKSITTIVHNTKVICRVDLIDENLVVIEHKTAARKYTQEKVDGMIQLSAEAFALATPIECEVHVALKHKTPSVQKLYTRRTVDDILWWRELAVNVIRGMENEVYPPNPGTWLCTPEYCGYYDDCKKGTTAYYTL